MPLKLCQTKITNFPKSQKHKTIKTRTKITFKNKAITIKAGKSSIYKSKLKILRAKNAKKLKSPTINALIDFYELAWP